MRCCAHSPQTKFWRPFRKSTGASPNTAPCAPELQQQVRLGTLHSQAVLRLNHLYLAEGAAVAVHRRMDHPTVGLQLRQEVAQSYLCSPAI